jgi:hypothetical protein
MSEQQVKPTALDYATEIAREIQTIVVGSITTVVNPTTIQIDNGGIISSVRVRDARKGSVADVKVTHGGKSKYEDTGAKVVGDSYVYKGQIVANIKEKAIKDIANNSTEWDINNISEGHVDQHNQTRIHEHPTIHWARAFNANGKIGISVELATPNAEQWEALKKDSKGKAVPSGKIVFKIISESDIDFDIEHDRLSIQGTIEQVDKVLARITGNPFDTW